MHWRIAATRIRLAAASHLLVGVVSILTAPFSFLVSSYVARAVLEKQSAERADIEAATFSALRRNEATEQANRMRLVETEVLRAHGLTDRAEFIEKIGTVRDYLGVLAIATEDSKRLLLRQAIDKELRDLIVKHTPQAMSHLIQRDDAVRLSLAAMLDALSQHGPLSADATTLQLGSFQ